ncbi:hypothetical protein [Deinococcus marmoris]|uniref:Uncharacterized protein n=1 Tax=Deinococcus marmoris TaxID=249408 RepID=A0A1U7P4R7_9DEIO|nr:hypothetical protein [Deinococcus marmoris]OLV20167.1 hypothetical protein BOO71_0000529 [Deinococcus marmoris]
MNLPWLPTTSSTKRLEADLKARGWRVWWTQGGSVRLFSPEGDTIEVDGATPAQAMRNAYASAQEYSNAQVVELALDNWQELAARA